MKYYHSFIFLLLGITSYSLFANKAAPEQCLGANSMPTVLDRPSVAYSPCTVGNKTVYVESGYAYERRTPNGYGYNLPQTEIRFGIINNTEIELFPPHFYAQNDPAQSGTGPNSLGLKHILFFNDSSIWTLQGYVTPPSGSRYYGTIDSSFLLNSIYSLYFSSGFNISTTLGLASNAAPSDAPADTFYTFNPIIDIGWNFTDKLAGYVELYAQSKYNVNSGFGLSTDGGLLYQLTPHVVLDVSYGHRIAGYLNNTNYYYGAGLTFAFGL